MDLPHTLAALELLVLALPVIVVGAPALLLATLAVLYR